MKTTYRLKIRRSADRGHAEHGWLDSRHTFSFADYYDPGQMGFRSLRVINDDHIAPLGGFPTHPHRDMEIFSYVLAGRLAHKDSIGNERVLHPGEIQLMSAGTGVQHSEYNPSSEEAVHLLQIWILPRERGLTPGYTEWKPPAAAESGKVLVISADGRDGSATIAQDADIWSLRLQPGEHLTHDLPPGRGLWLQVIKGSPTVNVDALDPGDAAFTEEPGEIELIAGDQPVEALLFDLG